MSKKHQKAQKIIDQNLEKRDKNIGKSVEKDDPIGFHLNYFDPEKLKVAWSMGKQHKA